MLGGSTTVICPHVARRRTLKKKGRKYKEGLKENILDKAGRVCDAINGINRNFLE